MTVENAVSMLFVGDIVIHTWDLARATGLDDSLDPAIAGEMLAGDAAHRRHAPPEWPLRAEGERPR